MTTHWDDDLSFLLNPALAAYENERVTGVTFGNSEFRDIVTRFVPAGHTFKGFPRCFNHMSPIGIMGTLLRAKAAVDIVKVICVCVCVCVCVRSLACCC